MSEWTPGEIQVLRRLREGFLQGTAGRSDYWDSRATLDLYDRTFGRRIGWKWDAVLAEVALRGGCPAGERLVDWGCGTGVATQRFLEQWPGFRGEVVLMDRSAEARSFALEKIRAKFPGVQARAVAPGESPTAGAVVLLSHVITELGAPVLAQWRAELERAESFVWVDSATHAASRRLVEEVREPLLGGRLWRVVGPCGHAKGCPLLEPKQGAHWCHHFARVPSEAHQDAGLAEFSRALNVDLRVLPYSFLAMQRVRTVDGESAGRAIEAARVLGRPEEKKGHFRVLSCEAEGIFERVLQKREHPAEYRRLRKAPGLMLYRFKGEGPRVSGAERLYGEGVEQNDSLEE